VFEGGYHLTPTNKKPKRKMEKEMAVIMLWTILMAAATVGVMGTVMALMEEE
jgi:hypothetical protein